MGSYITAVPGDECNGRMELLRAMGYSRVTVQGHRELGVVTTRDMWDITLKGAPCGGDHPNCLGTVPDGEYLCPVCRPLAEMPTVLREFLGV